jgi:DNA-binding transcriptional LysR family regulator
MGVDLRIGLHKLEVFSRVVQLGGVGIAAEQLFVTQPVVSAHLRSLERRLGVELFMRDGGRQRTLTPAGHAVYAWAQDVLSRTRDCERALQALASGDRGAVRVGAGAFVGSYVLPVMLASFHEDHPDVDVRLSISRAAQAASDVRAGVLDFAVVSAASDDEALTATSLWAEPVVLVADPAFLPDVASVAVDDIAALPLVGAEFDDWLDEGQLRAVGLDHARVEVEVGHPEAAKRAVRDGVGVTLLPYAAVASELDDGTLREIDVAGDELTQTVYLVQRTGTTLSPAAQAFADAVCAAFSTMVDHRGAPAALSA